jgi:hypothetical protein
MQMDRERSRRIVWMIKRMIKGSDKESTGKASCPGSATLCSASIQFNQTFVSGDGQRTHIGVDRSRTGGPGERLGPHHRPVPRPSVPEGAQCHRWAVANPLRRTDALLGRFVELALGVQSWSGAWVAVVVGRRPWSSRQIGGNLAVEGGDRVGGGFNRP